MHLFKKLMLILLILSSSYALDSDQIQLLNKVYIEGKKYKASDGFSFERTLCAIYITESSAGKELIGDKYTSTGILKSLYESSLGPGQIKLETALLVLNIYPYLQKIFKVKSHSLKIYHEYIKLIKLQRIYITRLSLLRERMYNRRITIREYRKLIKEIKSVSKKIHKINLELDKYRTYLKDDNKIINKLLTDIKFSVAISAHYLIYNYEIAKQKKMWKPYYKAVSKYNGGWLNYTYVKRVIRNLRYVNHLIKKGVIK